MARVLPMAGGGADKLSKLLGDLDYATLPTVLASGTLYRYDLDNGAALLSGSATNAGLWEVKGNIITQLRTTGNYTKFFEQNGYVVCVPTAGAIPCVHYDSGKGTATALSMPDGYTYLIASATPTKHGCLLPTVGVSAGRIYYLDADTLELTLVCTGGSSADLYGARHTIPEGVILADTTTSSPVGILLWDDDARKVTQYAGGQNNWKNRIDIPDGLLLSSTTYAGIWRYDSAARAMASVYSAGANWFEVLRTADGVMLSCAGTSNTGLLWYDFAERTITKIHATGYNWTKIYQSETEVLLSSANFSGILRLDLASYAVTMPYTTVAGWTVRGTFPGGCLMAASATTSSGLLMYLDGGGVIERIYATGYNWGDADNVTERADAILLSCSTNAGVGILRFGLDTHEITVAYSTGYGWIYRHEVEGVGVLFGSSTIANYGVLLYEDATGVATRKDNANVGVSWRTFMGLSNGDCLIAGEGSSASTAAGMLRYNKQDNTITQPYTLGWRWYQMIERPGHCWLWCDTTGTAGLLRYNKATGVIDAVPVATSYDWRVRMELPAGPMMSAEASGGGLVVLRDSDGMLATVTGLTRYKYRVVAELPVGLLVCSDVSGTPLGLWLIKYADLYNEQLAAIPATQLLTTGYGYRVVAELPYGLLLDANNSGALGVWLYEYDTMTVSKPYAAGWDWVNKYDAPDELLLGSSGNYGALSYNKQTRQVTQIINVAAPYKYFSPIKDGALIATDAASYVGQAYVYRFEHTAAIPLAELAYAALLGTVRGIVKSVYYAPK